MGKYNKKEIKEFLAGTKTHLNEYSRRDPEVPVYDWSPWIGENLKGLPESEFGNANVFKQLFGEDGNPLVFKVGDYVYDKDEIYAFIEGFKNEKPKKYCIRDSRIISGRWAINIMFEGKQTQDNGHSLKTLYPHTAVLAERYEQYLSEQRTIGSIDGKSLRIHKLLVDLRKQPPEKSITREELNTLVYSTMPKKYATAFDVLMEVYDFPMPMSKLLSLLETFKKGCLNYEN